MTLNYYLQKAKKNHFAIPHFNFSTAEQLKAIILGFENVLLDKKLKEDYCLMVGLSEKEADFFGYSKARALVYAWKNDTNLAIFLNADHHKSFESCKKALQAGFDSIHFDGSSLSFEENIELTKKIVDYARSLNPEISLEGELGYLPGESIIQEFVEVKRENYTQPEKVKEFVEKTGINRLAIVFGNIHGITTKQKMELDFNLLKKINETLPDTFLVLHGGSGLTDEDFKKSIENGITNIHINTEIRIAYRKGIEEKFKEDQEIRPYKFLEKAVEEMKKVAEEKIEIFLNK